MLSITLGMPQICYDYIYISTRHHMIHKKKPETVYIKIETSEMELWHWTSVCLCSGKNKYNNFVASGPWKRLNFLYMSIFEYCSYSKPLWRPYVCPLGFVSVNYLKRMLTSLSHCLLYYIGIIYFIMVIPL